MRYARAWSGLLSAVLLGIVSSPAFAVGTGAGTTVTNDVTLDYQVNGFDQATVTASVDFEVDRALRVTVATGNADVVAAVPGQDFAGPGAVPALIFDVTNTSNDTVDLLLGLVDRDATAVTGFAGNTGGGPLSPSAVGLFLDDGGTPGAVDGTNTALTVQGNHWILPNVTEDVPIRVLVAVSVPNTAAQGEQATYTLVAAVAEAGLGTLIAGDSNGRDAPGSTGATDVVDDPTLVQDVFADLATVDGEDFVYDFVADAGGTAADVTSNGQHADSSAFVVDAAELYIAKIVQVLWDPINGNRYSANNSDTDSGNNPKAIPGAVVMYAIGVQNDTGSQPVTGVAIADDVDNLVSVGTTEAVNWPDTVSIDLNSVPVAFDVPNAAALGSVNFRTCGGIVGSQGFGADPAEVSVSLGACSATQTGLIVYVVTIPAS